MFVESQELPNLDYNRKNMDDFDKLAEKANDYPFFSFFC
jgi:hypothetical protein